VIAPFVSKEEQSCVTALVQLVRSSKSAQKEDLLLPPSGALPLGFLTLPFISRHVPVTSVIDEDDGKWLQAARVVRRAG